MSDVVVVERDFPSFFDAPFVVHPPGAPFSSPLRGDLKAMVDERKNPFFRRGAGTYFTALRDGRPVGRILAHVYFAANERWGEQASCFGFFDVADDGAAAAALLGRAEAFGRAHGATICRGAMNMTAAQEMGVVVDGFEHGPYVAQVWNPPHVPRLLMENGWRGGHPMRTFSSRDLARYDADAALTDRHRALLSDPAWRFRTVDMKRFDAELEAVRDVLNDAMHDNHLFVALTPEEMRFQLGPFEQIADPSIVWIAEHEGRPVAASLVAPDVVPLLRSMKSRLTPVSVAKFLLGRRRIRDACIVVLLVKRAYHGRGVIGVLNHHVMRSLQRGGYRSCGVTWISDANRPSLRQMELLDMQPRHRTDLFEKAL